MQTTDPLAEKLVQEMEVERGNRSGFEQQWREISERVLPRSSDLFYGGGRNSARGQKLNQKMLDSTAALALDRYTAVKSSLMTPQDAKWHRLRSVDPERNRISRVSRWFDTVTDALFRRRRSPRSGFYSAVNEAYTSEGAFGTGAVFVDYVAPTPTDPAGGMRYRFVHISELFVKENFAGFIDTVMRTFVLRHDQVPGMVTAGYFDRLPKGLDKLLSTGKHNSSEYSYLLVVRPNDELDPGRSDYRGMAYVGYYVCVDTKEVIGRTGYHSMPFVFCRATVTPGEAYGRSPAMTVLPNIKVLNEQKKTSLKVGHRMADPVLLTHDDGVLDTPSLRPGAVVPGAVSSDGRKLVARLDDNIGQLPALDDQMDAERAVIKDAFLVSLFQLLTETPRMTATEVLERTREKSILLAPTMARQQSEFLGMLIEREVDLMVRNGAVPPPPPELEGGEYEPQYDSPLSRVMRAEEAVGLSRWLEQTLQAVQITQDPAPLDWVNWDAVQPELAEINAVPARWVASMDEVMAKRGQREQQQAVQTAIDAAPGVAGLAKLQQGGGYV